RVGRIGGAFSGRALSLPRQRGRQRACRSRSGRTHSGGRNDHGGATPRLSRPRSSIPSRVGADRGGAEDSSELPRPVMFPQLIEKLVRHEDLTTDEAAQAMREVMEGRAAPSALAGLLAALVMKGERPEEIAGLARTRREHAVRLTTSPGEVFDTCGTGGDRSGTFNVSSAAAI